MRIAYVGTLPPHPGGSASVGLSVLRGLAQRGHEVHAIAPITAETAQSEPLRGESFSIARYRVSHFESAPNQPASERFRADETQAVTARLAPLLEAGHIDLVIAGRETFAWQVPGLAHAHDRACVLLAHGATTWGVLDGSFPQPLAQRLIAAMGEADCVIAVAHHLERRLRELGLSRVRTIANAVDPRVFAPAPPDPALQRSLGIDAARVVVAHLSNFKALKRPLDIVAAAAAALPREPRLLYLIVGDGPTQAAMQDAVLAAGLRDDFRFTGWVPHSEVHRYLHLSDIVVLPSQAEALAMIYLETQACGRVLIASDIAAAREVVQDGRTGLLFPLGDIATLVEVTLRAAQDAALRAAIGEQARAATLARPLDAALDEYEAVLRAYAH